MRTSAPLAAALEAATRAEVLTLTAVGGGDTAAAYRVDLADGATIFAKTHAAPPAGFFTTEAAGLAWMCFTATVAVPEVIAVSDGDGSSPAFLALAWIDQGRPGVSTDAELGRSLAGLHRAGAPHYGRADRRTTGSLGLPNEPCATWSEFVAANRFLPLARIARDRRSLPEHAIVRLEQLAASLYRFDDGAPPARLHGDLWAGNRLVDTDGTSWLIDPACHGGHREFDLAMMRLFGGFGPHCFDAYAEVSELADGWFDRIALHQIAPLVVHAVTFGGGYVAAATAAIERY